MQVNLRQERKGLEGGFTLLEIVFVLAMVAVLVTWLTVSLSTVETEQKLRDAVGPIELMAKRGLNVAVMQQRPYRLTIDAHSVSIAPRYALGQDDSGFEAVAEQELQNGFEDVVASEATDADVSYEIKRWRSNDWQLIEKDKHVELILSPVGLMEPISIRYSLGRSWLKHELHPLTAGARDEELYIVKE